MTSGYTGPWSPGSVCELRKDTLTTGIGDEADQGDDCILQGQPGAFGFVSF